MALLALNSTSRYIWPAVREAWAEIYRTPGGMHASRSWTTPQQLR
jgi:hypothetical protein